MHDFKRSVVNVFWLTAMCLFYSSTSNSLAVPSTPVFSFRFELEKTFKDFVKLK